MEAPRLEASEQYTAQLYSSFSLPTPSFFFFFSLTYKYPKLSVHYPFFLHEFLLHIPF
jgi:hypothetical protein